MTLPYRELRPGEVYKAKVSRISRSGDTIIEHPRWRDGEHINLGKTKKKFGDAATFKYLGQGEGRALKPNTAAVSSYAGRIENDPSENDPSENDPSENDVRAVIVNRISNTGEAIAERPDGDLNLGPLKPSVVGETVEVELNSSSSSQCARCLDEEYIKDKSRYRLEIHRMSKSHTESESSGGSDEKVRGNTPSPSDKWKDRKGDMMSDLNNFG